MSRARKQSRGSVAQGSKRRQDRMKLTWEEKMRQREVEALEKIADHTYNMQDHMRVIQGYLQTIANTRY